MELWKLTAGQKLKRPEFDGKVRDLNGWPLEGIMMVNAPLRPGLMSWGKGGIGGGTPSIPIRKRNKKLTTGLA